MDARTRSHTFPRTSAQVLRNRRLEAAGDRTVRDAGFSTIDLGNLKTGGLMQQIHHPLAGIDLMRQDGT
jgi:hypothetical protein